MHISLLWHNTRLRLAVYPASCRSPSDSIHQSDHSRWHYATLHTLTQLLSLSLFPPQAWPTVKRTFELYPGAAMPYNEHRISGKIASIFALEHMNACGRGRGKSKGWAVRKCANKLLAKSFCAKCRRRWLSELHFWGSYELRVTSDEFTTLTKCLQFGRNCLLNCFSSRLVKCVFPVRVCVGVCMLSPSHLYRTTYAQFICISSNFYWPTRKIRRKISLELARKNRLSCRILKFQWKQLWHQTSNPSITLNICEHSIYKYCACNLTCDSHRTSIGKATTTVANLLPCPPPTATIIITFVKRAWQLW